MEHTYEKMIGKSSDYIECNNCGRINWHENDRCLDCNLSITNPDTMTDKHMDKFIKEEYNFYVNGEGYTEKEFWRITLTV